MFQTFTWKIEDNIGNLMLNQAPSNNLNILFFQELKLFRDTIFQYDSLQGIIIYGSGHHFSSGTDLKELVNHMVCKDLSESGNKYQVPNFLYDNNKSFSFFEELKIPVYAVIKGVCLGSAFELALACQFRICADNAVLGMPESTFGIIPGCGGTIRLPKITGYAKAIELITEGRNFSAHEALEWGIVDKVLPKKEVMNYAIKLIHKEVSLINQAI